MMLFNFLFLPRYDTVPLFQESEERYWLSLNTFPLIQESEERDWPGHDALLRCDRVLCVQHPRSSR